MTVVQLSRNLAIASLFASKSPLKRFDRMVERSMTLSCSRAENCASSALLSPLVGMAAEPIALLVLLLVGNVSLDDALYDQIEHQPCELEATWLSLE